MIHATHAWLLTLAPNIKIAVAESQMIEYLLNPPVSHVPLAPTHCHYVTFWRNRIIPLLTVQTIDSPPGSPNQKLGHIQLLRFNTLSPPPPNTEPNHDTDVHQPEHRGIALNKSDSTSCTNFIALQLQAPPQRIIFDDPPINTADPLQLSTWRSALISSFKYQSCSVSIVDFSALNGAPLRMAEVDRSARPDNT